MKYVRTTLRIQHDLKREAQQYAFAGNCTLQEVFNGALEAYLRSANQRKAKKILFRTHDLKTPLDNLRRSDFYASPDI